MACLKLDLCNYLDSAEDAKSPITGFGPYKQRSDRTREFRRLLREQQSQIDKLKRQRKKLKKRIKRIKMEKKRMEAKKELTPKDRNYINELENTLTSAVSMMAKNEALTRQAQQGIMTVKPETKSPSS